MVPVVVLPPLSQEPKPEMQQPGDQPARPGYSHASFWDTRYSKPASFDCWQPVAFWTKNWIKTSCSVHSSQDLPCLHVGCGNSTLQVSSTTECNGQDAHRTDAMVYVHNT
eukprot:1160463-Pelagomonas_calceolata.AAC.5